MVLFLSCVVVMSCCSVFGVSSWLSMCRPLWERMGMRFG